MASQEYANVEPAEDALQSPNEYGQTIDQLISTNNYIQEYMAIDNVPLMREIALKTGLPSCLFRSVCWRIFLQCLPESSKDRIAEIRKLREKYRTIQKKYRQDPRSQEEDVGHDNPLSQDENSHWNCYFSDVELQTRIKQDVVRAFPDINFFQSEKIQTIMTNILFNYARENPQIDYKQGMHEILAPLIFVIHCDIQSYLSAQEKGLKHEEIAELLDQDYLEHDSYFVFLHVMESIDSWYDNRSVQTYKKNEYLNMEPFSNDFDFNCYSKIGIKLQMINEELFHKYDEELYKHLKELKIAPQIYGIRWMRLLFIREFQMQDLLALWDAIFANGVGLCDYIFTAMLVVIRNILLPCDYANCLNHLMRYPSVADVHYVIHLALHIRDPLNYPEPVEHSTLVLPNPNAIKVQEANRYPSTLFRSNNNSKARNVAAPASRPKSLLISSPQKNTLNGGKGSNEMRPVSFEWIDDKMDAAAGGGGDESCRSRTCSSSKEVESLKYKIDFCAHYMSKHLDVLQAFMNTHGRQLEKSSAGAEVENVLISIAEMKKIRDILKGSIAFESSLTK